MTLIDKAEAVTLLHEIANDFADPHVRGAAIAVAHIFTERADALPPAKQEHVADSNARGVGITNMIDKPFVVKVANIVEHEDESTTLTFDLDEEAKEGLCKIGLEFVLYCAAYELDLQYVLDNLKRLKSE